MSWRFILRIAGLVLAGRVLTRRRAAGRGMPSLAGLRPLLARRLAGLRRDLGIAARALTLAVLLAASAVLITAGTSSTLLSPRWLGLVLLGLAGLALIAALVEARGLRRSVLERRLQRRDDAVRRQP